MSKDFKLFTIALFLSIPFWLGVNFFEKTAEDFYFSKITADNPPVFYLANILESYQKKELERRITVPKNILAESYISVEISPNNGEEKVILSKNKDKKLPIASLTKLMTAVIATEFYQPDLKITISQKAVSQPEEIGFLKAGEVLTVDELTRIMLIESSNDAAFALTEPIGTESFVHLMNLKAKELGMKNTVFFNPTGIDPDDPAEENNINLSTVEDLAILARYILKNDYLMKIISTKEYPLYLQNGIFHHNLKSTNQLLGEMPRVIGGKTGFTEKAGGCLLEISKGKKPDTYLITIVLNSPLRFNDMKEIIEASY